jgi:hypothetical protein
LTNDFWIRQKPCSKINHYLLPHPANAARLMASIEQVKARKTIEVDIDKLLSK